MIKFFRINQLLQLTSALFREIIREPGVLFWGILFPILMSLGLGLAFTKKADVVRKIAVIDTQKNSLNDTSRGTVNVILKDNEGATEYHFDPMNSDAELAYLKLSSVIGSGSILPEGRSDEIKPLTVTGTRYIDFLVPGLIAMGIMMSCMWGISYGIIDKRSKKLLRRLVATPMKKSHFLVALITVRLTMNLIEAVVLIIFAILAFHMTIQGSISALIILFIAGNIAFAGIAVLVSSHTSNTEVGNGLINFVVMPMMVLSGVFFSYHNFPDWSIGVIQKLPLTMLADGMRSIFNEGAGYKEVAIPVLILTVTGVIFFGAGLKIFKWH
jgi:ABC-2 type transport system permease protein